jgi:DNA repair ATPase RecN
MSDHEKIYNKLDEIAVKLAGICTACAAREKELADHEERLRDLEAARNKWLGAIAVLSFALGALGAVIATILKKVL